MKKLVLFYNPVSGHAAFKNKLDWIVEAFQRRGILLMLYRTKKEGNEDFATFVREVEPDGILAAGGDGTVHECVNILMKHQIDLPLGIIGSGTSNDFATYLKINEDMEAYFDRIAAGQVQRVDLGRVGDEYFINVASAGMMTSIAHEVDARLKNAMGKMAYYIKGIGELPKFRSVSLSIDADDQHYDIEAFLFVVINSSVVGSMKKVAENVSVTDGKLDLLAVSKCGIPKLVTVTADLVSGKPISEKEYILHLQASRFRISTTEVLESDLDGEAGPNLPLTIETVPSAIAVYC
ncbi:MAG: YegS/Rv2252/BmrU family lipid kinase [Selenomonas sp.]|nr:YegS/Rv2252/BmrU family lipid kinase [Selenomonas sp.]